MTDRQTNPVSLDRLASSKLPERVLAAIAEMELTVAELVEWDASKPDWRIFRTEDGDLIIEMRVRLSRKKLLAVLGSIAGLLWATADFVLDHLPTLQAFLDRVPPAA